MAGIEHAPLGDVQLHRFQAPLVQRNGIPYQTPEHVEHRRAGDGEGGIEVARMLRRGAVEIDGDTTPNAVHTERHPDPAAVVHGILEDPVVQPRHHPAHRLLGIVLDVSHVGLHRLQPELLDHAFQLFHPLLTGGELRPQVGQIAGHVPRRPPRPHDVPGRRRRRSAGRRGQTRASPR